MAQRKYDDLSKEELLRLLEARDRRDATRFGLVWETKEIEHDKARNQDFVALDLDPALSCGNAPFKNLIIEGDNFDALRYLRMTFAGRVKCIYIDPPYNTGNKDFVYNDHYVDKEDLWRHSTWLEFMYQRLTLARDLLSNDGAILIHIGEDEVDNLGCLMDGIFRGRKVGKLVWRTRSGARVSQNHFLSVDHEYVICYANPGFEFAGSTKSFADYGNPDGDPRGDWANFNLTKGQSFKDRPRSFYPLQNPANAVWYAPNPDRVWAFSSQKYIKKGQKLVGLSMEDVIEQKKVLWPVGDRIVKYQSLEDLLAAIDAGTAPRHIRKGLPDLDQWVGKEIGYGMPRYKMHKYELDATHNPLSTWLRPSGEENDDANVESLEVGSTAEGASLLSAMLGTKTFSYPKPLSLAQALIEQATRPGDIVLDFFAGSGTAGHAVLNLNADDIGAATERRFILVSNTEATKDNPTRNICRDVCRERVLAAVQGYEYAAKAGLKKIPGVGGDFAYLRTRRIAPGKLTDIDHAQVWTALQLTHMPALTPFDEAARFVTADHDGQRLIYVPHLRAKDAKALVKAVAASPATIVYTWQPQLAKTRLRDAANVQIEAVPESLARRFGIRI